MAKTMSGQVEAGTEEYMEFGQRTGAVKTGGVGQLYFWM